MTIGDRVRIVCGSVPRKGQTGTIVGVTGTESPLHWFIDFGDWTGLYRGDEFVLLEEGGD